MMTTNKRGLKSKKGLSDIVATLIIVLLVIVAAGIIWVVIRNVVQGGAEQVEFGQKCLEVDLEYVSVVQTAAGITTGCTGTQTAYNVTLKRLAGGDAIAGISVSLLSATDSFGPEDFGILTELQTDTQIMCSTVANANKVEYTAYFEDSAGTPVYCQTNERALS